MLLILASWVSRPADDGRTNARSRKATCVAGITGRDNNESAISHNGHDIFNPLTGVRNMLDHVHQRNHIISRALQTYLVQTASDNRYALVLGLACHTAGDFDTVFFVLGA
jgi:hypothetical protein